MEGLREHGLSPDYCLDLGGVTRDKRTENYHEFIHRCSLRPRSRRVKIADIIDNLSRIGGLPVGDRDRLERRYRKALDVLRNEQEVSR